MLAILTRLKQLCNFDKESGESVKLDVIRSLLDAVTVNRERVLIFSQYVSALEWISERIELPTFHLSWGVKPRCPGEGIRRLQESKTGLRHS